MRGIFFSTFAIVLLMLINLPALPAEENDRTGQEANRHTLLQLPFGRDFTALFTIMPGVNNEEILSGLSIRGASGEDNRFFIDSAETTNLMNGTSGQMVNLDFAESVTFKSFGFDASEDAAIGGTLRVITRSGTNRFYKELIGYYESDKLTGEGRKHLALDINDPGKAAYYSYEEWVGSEEWDRFRLGIALGGPVFRDKLWFFGAILPTFYDKAGTHDFALLEYEGEPQIYTRHETAVNFLVKLTARPVKGLNLGASVVNNHFRYKGNKVYNAYSGAWEDHSVYGYSYPNFSISGYMDITPSENFQINLRGGYFHSNQHKQQITVLSPRHLFYVSAPYGNSTNEKWSDYYKDIGREDLIHPAAYWYNYGYNDGFEVKKAIRDRSTLNADISYFLEGLGSHAVRAGIQYVNRRENVDESPTYPYLYFGWDMDFEAGGIHYGRGEYGFVEVRGNSAAPFGNIYNVSMDQWAIYLQDSWTIGKKLTLNIGVRTESEYIPGYSDLPELSDLKPIKFTFADKISPRLGFVFDIKGDGSARIFGHFGIYRDHLKLQWAAGALGGFKWYSAYYPLDTLRYDQLTGEEGEPYIIINHRIPSFDRVDPDIKPAAQREISLGFQKILSANLVLSGAIINKSLLWAIDDVGVLVPGMGEYYYYANPGSDSVKEKYQIAREAGLMEPDTPDLPKAKREYWGVTLALEKRFVDHWMGGVFITLSSLRGNDSGIPVPDMTGRSSPIGERLFDLWHLSYTKDLQPIDGPLPADRPIVAKAYGSYMFPFRLNLGMVINAMSGTPVTEEWNVDSTGYFPFNRGNMGRTPFLFLADLLISQEFRIGKVTFNLNAAIRNLFNIQTATGIYSKKTRYGISPTDREKIDNSWTFESRGGVVDPRFGMDNAFVPPIRLRLGARISF